MSSPVAQLESGLNAMLSLKPPGVSGSQIKNLTTLCVENVQSESVLIQKMYTHFKKVPGTHKLGVLYVVDSVTRRWIEQAKQQGQSINSSAPDGTFAAGVHRVTELLPVLMNDILQSAPPEQKEKIKKLVDIWEKGQTFPTSMIETFKQKLNAPVESTTPVGSPPPGPGLPGLPGFNGAADNKSVTTEPPNTTAIMEALASIARLNTTSAPPSSNGLAAPMNSSTPTIPQNGLGQQAVPAPAAAQPPAQHVTQSQPPFPFPAASAPVDAPPLPFAYPPQVSVSGQAPPIPVTSGSLPSGFPSAAIPPLPAAGANPAIAQQQMQLVQLLLNPALDQNQKNQILSVLMAMQGGLPQTAQAGAPAAPPVPPAGQAPPFGGSWAPRPDESRDHPDFRARSPDRYRTRSRSRSPARHWDSRDSPRGRTDRGYGDYGRDSPGRAHTDDQDRWGRGSDYRQRSPAGRRGSSPGYDRPPPPPGQKWVDYDRTIPEGHIKVLSRTLFVGGVTCSEAELREAFNRHGQVQTCIVNKDKRHAFVKMISRHDAVAAKDAMENSSFRTRWGVGFGPRDCSDYSTGISVIPINKLTEADRKWMLTAEYGGSGGRPIETGLVVEEPDIEIGAGVSSKAISRRMQTDKGGRHGPKSSRDDDDTNLARWRRNKDHRRDDRRDDRTPVVTSQQPAVPEFPYGITAGPNGMPIYPPGFAFPAPNP